MKYLISAGFILLALAASMPLLPQSSPEACPEAQPGVEITVTMSWAGLAQPYTILMPAAVNEGINRYVADNCLIYGKDITGSITGKQGAPLPQEAWALNFIIANNAGHYKAIVAQDPERYGDADTQTKAAAARSAAATKQAAVDSAEGKALQVVP